MSGTKDVAGMAGPGPEAAGVAARLRRLRSWLAARGLAVFLLLACCLPVALLGVLLAFAWHDTWREAESEMLRTTAAARDYAARMLDLHRVLGQRVDDMLADLSDAEIEQRETVLHDRIKALLGQLARPPTVMVMSREGQVLLAVRATGADPEVPAENRYRDRDYFRALSGADAPPVFVGARVTGQLSGAAFFTLSQRRTGAGNGLPPGAFDGLVSVVVFVDDQAAELRGLRVRDTDRVSVVRSDGEVLLTTLARRAPLAVATSTAVRRVSAALPPTGTLLTLAADDDRPERLVGFSPVAGWPVYVTAARPTAEIVAQWRGMAARQMAIGLPAIALVALLARLIWRRQAALQRAYRGLEAEVRQRTAALADSEAEFRALFHTSAIAKAQAAIGTWRYIRVNARFCDLVGHSAAALTGGMGVFDLVPAEDRPATLARFEAAMAAGDHFEEEGRYRRGDGRLIWAHVSVALVPDAQGRPQSVVVSFQDVTDRRAADERQALLAREVDHRAKNALAVVQAALRLTPKDDAAVFARTIEGRVTALARAQTMLAESHWQGTELRSLVEGELAAFLTAGEDAPRVRLIGEALPIAPAISQAIALALHELATNATKHGALSRPGGLLEVSWQAAANRLRLEWREVCHGTVAPPAGRSGFGSRLLNATIVHQLGGRLERDWRPEGLHCVLSIPLDRRAAEGPPVA